MPSLKMENDNLDIDLIYIETLEREREIRKIEREILSISETYNELAEIISLQGNMLDRIETCIENSIVQTEKASYELEKAKSHLPWFGVFGRLYRIGKWVLG